MRPKTQEKMVPIPPACLHGRRPGDPSQIIAASDRDRAMLGWTPQYDDLVTIIAHALAWEKRLQKHVPVTQ